MRPAHRVAHHNQGIGAEMLDACIAHVAALNLPNSIMELMCEEHGEARERGGGPEHLGGAF